MCYLQIIVMMVTILSVFAICWLPYQISILYNEHRSDSQFPVSLQPIVYYSDVLVLEFVLVVVS